MTTAFVLGGGGLLGAHEVGMVRALSDAGIRPDLVVGTSIGAINGAFVAADPDRSAQRLGELWRRGPSGTRSARTCGPELSAGSFGHAPAFDRAAQACCSPDAAVRRVQHLELPFQCVAASIERWRPLVQQRAAGVLASCAVPGLLPPVQIGDEHCFDGGLVDSIPVGRAIALGATTVYVLQVGRIENPLTVPKRPWQVGLVAFEIARRHRFNEEMSELPEGVAAHLLSTGGNPRAPDLSHLRYRDKTMVVASIERAYAASARYLAALAGR